MVSGTMLIRRFFTVALFLSLGALVGHGQSFLEAPQYASSENPFSVAVGDFNNDGKLDLAVACEFLSTVSVMLGNGDGTFQPRQDFATETEPISVAVADLNGDGKLDVVTADF